MEKRYSSPTRLYIVPDIIQLYVVALLYPGTVEAEKISFKKETILKDVFCPIHIHVSIFYFMHTCV